MISIGISALGHDPAIAIVRDGEILYAVEEERVSRVKGEWCFPERALDQALDHCGFALNDVTDVAYYWNDLGSLPEAFRAEARSLLDRRVPTVHRLLRRIAAAFSNRKMTEIVRRRWGNHNVPRVSFIDHHHAHAHYAFRVSGFQRALVVVLDGRGENASVSVYVGEDGGLALTDRTYMPASLGFVYGAITQHLGFRPASDEYRVMGLAPYGVARDSLDRFFERLLRCERGRLIVDHRYTNYQRSEHPDCPWLSPRAFEWLGPPRLRDQPVESRHADIARALQARYEAVAFAILEEYKEKHPDLPLVLAGGCAMNSVFNGKLVRSRLFEEVFIPAAPGDQGAAIGAALSLFSHRQTSLHVASNRSARLGPAFSREVIIAALKDVDLPFTEPADLVAEIARLMANGQIGGLFEGRMEFGPRALGGRSIIADPRPRAMRDRINAAVKLREPFRPFAASILAPRVAEYVDAGCDFESPYMNMVMPVRAERRDAIAAVCHVDGSCRFQTVSSRESFIYRLIEAFDAVTGIPMILNTSFNQNGEPIVMSPSNAISCFARTSLDFLVIGDFLVRREPAP